MNKALNMTLELMKKSGMHTLDFLPYPVLFRDTKNCFLECNHSASKFLNLTNSSDLIGKSYQTIASQINLSEKTISKLLEMEKWVIKHGEDKSITTYLYPPKSQNENLYLFRCSPIINENFHVVALVITIMDIPDIEKKHHIRKDDRVLSSDELKMNTDYRNSNFSLEKLIDHMPVNVFWMSKDLTCLGCNDNVIQSLGFHSKEEVIGKSYHDLLGLTRWSNEAIRSFERDDLWVIKHDKPINNKEEPPLIDANGNTIYYLTNRVPLHDDTGEVIGVIGISIDISDRKRVETLVHEKNKLKSDLVNLNELIAHMPGNVYWMDNELNYLGCNDNVAKLLGINAREEIVGKTYEDFKKITGWNNGQLESFKDSDIKVMKDDKPLINVEEPPITDPEGNEIYYITNRVPLHDKTGQVVGVAGISIDVTDKKKLESLEKENEIQERTITQLKALAGGIAHQITNPLAGIKSAFGYIERKFPQLIQAYKKSRKTSNPEPQLSSQQIENIEFKITQIKQRIDKTQYIIDHHLMNIKSNYNKLLIDTTSIKDHSMTSIIEDTISDFPFIEQQKNLVHWQGGEDFKVHGVKFLLVHVLNNLIDNALDSVHFSNKSDAKVTIWLEQNKATHVYLLHIKDTGLGLPHDGRSDLFKPFHTKRNNGTGLGLYFCKTVMEAHHGRIIARGRKDEYAQFTLIFPNPKEFSRYRRRAYKKLLMAQ